MENFSFKRVGKPSKFYYQNMNTGKKINDKSKIEHFKNLKIPPNYRDVYITDKPDYKVQAYGYDSKGRKQAIYHKDFVDERSTKKFSDIKKFALLFNKIDTKINKLLKLPGWGHQKAIAVVLYIMIHCNFRIGNEKNVYLYNSYGITTLRKKHIKIKNNTIYFSFLGKKSILNEGSIYSEPISQYLKHFSNKCKPDDPLFLYETVSKKLKRINGEDINLFLKQWGDNITSKSIRIFRANQLFVQKMSQFEKSNSITKTSIVHTIKEVSKDLHNTSAVCKRSYLHPELLEYYNKIL